MSVNGIFQNGVYGCSFDFLNSANPVTQIFDSVAGGAAEFTASNTRFGTGLALLLSGAFCDKNLDVNLTQLIDGFAFMAQGLPATGWALVREWSDTTAGAVQVSLQCNSQGQLAFFQGSGTSTMLGSATPAGTVVINGYIFLQVQITFATGGNISYSFIGAQTWTGTISGVNTAPSGNAYCNQVIFQSLGFPGGGLAVYFDDWYMLDLTGTAPLNAFLGNGRYASPFYSSPTGESATGGLNTWSFTTPQGSDYGNFANVPANASDYASSGTVGARASCTFPSLSASRVFFFNAWDSDELDASGTRTISIVTRNNGTDQDGPSFQPNTTFAFHNSVSTIDPNTGQPWANGLVANSNAMEIGPEVIS